MGITYPDLEAIRSVTNTNHGDYEKSYRVVIDDLNKQGGINGRKIVPVFAAINPLGTAPAQEACLKLTEDEKVFAAMSFFNADAPLCFVDSHDTPLLGGQTTSTNLAHAKAPWATLESGAELGPRQIDALVKAGALKGKLGHRRHRRRGAEPAEGRRAARVEAAQAQRHDCDHRRAVQRPGRRTCNRPPRSWSGSSRTA